jgi:hypothetical protein
VTKRRLDPLAYDTVHRIKDGIVSFNSLHSIATVVTPALASLLRQDPTPLPTEAVVYSVVSADGQAQVAQTIFSITSGDLLQSMLLMVIAILLLAILITLIWRRNA